LSDDQTQRSETNPQVTATESASDGPLELIELYARMALIRAFETRVSELYRDGEIPGFVHTSLGQEAVAVGVCAALRDDDYLATTHRGHGHCLAKGADVDGMMAELFAKQTGLCRGKGGSMHVADPARGILGANAIVGASIPLAVGAGLTSKLLALGRVAVAFFGEGAANQGAFHEAVNLAAIWSLPVLFVCENNVYSEFSDSRSMSRLPSIAERTKAYGIDATVVDGNDVTVVRDESLSAVSRCRAGDGPVLLEAETYRWQGHYEGDAQPYKPAEESASWKLRDPLVLARRRLLAEQAASDAQLDASESDARSTVEEAVERARAAPAPPLEEAYEHVFSD
jgi:TPP-dependent pyruvate/acetoin dehydrogenase alpha subunit